MTSYRKIYIYIFVCVRTGLVKYSPDPFPRLPGHRGELQDPCSLAVKCGHVAESHMMACDRGRMAFPGWAQNKLSHSLSHLPADGQEGREHAYWTVTGFPCKPRRGRSSTVWAANVCYYSSCSSERISRNVWEGKKKKSQRSHKMSRRI